MPNFAHGKNANINWTGILLFTNKLEERSNGLRKKLEERSNVLRHPILASMWES